MKEYIPLVFFACIVTHTHCHSNGIKLQDFWIFFLLKIDSYPREGQFQLGQNLRLYTEVAFLKGVILLLFFLL